MMLVGMHGLRADLFPEFLAPVAGRGVAEDVYVGARCVDVVFVFGVEHHPRAIAAHHLHEVTIRGSDAGHQAAVVLRAAAEDFAVTGRYVDVVKHGIDESADAHRPGLTKIFTDRDTTVVGCIN
jgi:hypothetical protein